MLRALEWTALLGFHLAFLFIFTLLCRDTGTSQWPWVLAAVLFSIFLADLFTGFVHWVCDSIGRSTTPIWGPMLVKPFRDHHREPLRITVISLAENLGSSSIAGLIVLGLSMRGLFLAGDFSILSWFWLFFIGFGVWSNLFHRWSHLPLSRRPVWLKVLQDAGLVLHPKEHSMHHRRPFRRNYCILNGWANSVTNRLPWQRFENVLKRFGVTIDFD